MSQRCIVLSSCPICGSGTLKPVSAGKIIYLFEGNERHDLGKSQVYSCGSNGHLVIIPAKRNQMQISEANSASAGALESTRVLNSWKEIANHMGRGVRTVQRWERELGLPVRRPRGKSRSAVIALAADLDEWLHRAPVGLGPDSNGNGSILNPSQSSAPDETTGLDRSKFVPSDKQKARTAFDSLS
jgi:hypothetical protein